VKEGCKNCGYERVGRCHRWPPTTHVTYEPRDGTTDPNTETITVWPEVDTYTSDAWCGEWKHPSDLIKLVMANGS